MAPSEAVQCEGAATLASAQDMPLEHAPNITASEIAATAITLLGVSAATTVNSAIQRSPTMVGILRLETGEKPAAISRSAIQPPPMLPTTPKAKGIAATTPVRGIDICRSISK